MVTCRVDKKRVRPALAAAALLVLAGTCPGIASPTTRPLREISGWFDELASPDPIHREEARTRLMGLAVADLAILRDAVAARSKVAALDPNQAQMLRDVVVQVYLAGQYYEANAEGKGWLGIGMSQALLVESESDPSSVRGVGMVVDSRMPGFGAYRWLADGDVVRRIREAPHAVLETIRDLQNAVATFHAGDVIHLDVVRGGEGIVVTMTLDARPELVDRSRPEFYAARSLLIDEAETYYETHFASLVEPK